MAREEREVNHFERKGSVSLAIAIHLPHLHLLSLSLPGLHLSRPQLASGGGFSYTEAASGGADSLVQEEHLEAVSLVLYYILFFPTATSSTNTTLVAVFRIIVTRKTVPAPI